jgi:hypothetical protein
MHKSRQTPKGSFRTCLDWGRSLLKPSPLECAIAQRLKHSRRLVREASTWQPLEPRQPLQMPVSH